MLDSLEYFILVDALAGDKIDIGVDLTVTDERLNLIDYAVPILEDKYVIFAKHQAVDSTSNIFSFLSPLSNVSWIGILVSLIAILFSIQIMYFISLSDKNTAKESFLHFLWLAFLTLFGLHEMENLSRLKSLKLLQLSWSLFLFLMVSCYTANLAASLTVKKMDKRVHIIFV